METRDSRLESREVSAQRSRQELGDQQSLVQKGQLLSGENERNVLPASRPPEINHDEARVGQSTQAETKLDGLQEQSRREQLKMQEELLGRLSDGAQIKELRERIKMGYEELVRRTPHG